MSYTSTDHISVTLDDRILRIAFNRPEKKNAITAAMYAAMADAINQAQDDATVRVITIEGSEGCFTSGNDLGDFMNNPESGGESSVGRFLRELAVSKKPAVAAVTGMAVGIGTTMLLHCDFAYASDNAKFHMPFVSLGLVPEFGSSYILPELLGYRRAAELLMLAKPFDAAKAESFGIINEIAADPIATALETANALAALPPAAVRKTKALMRKGAAESIASQMAEEGGHFAEALTSPEATEAFTAFMQKRKPDFSNFE